MLLLTLSACGGGGSSEENPTDDTDFTAGLDQNDTPQQDGNNDGGNGAGQPIISATFINAPLQTRDRSYFTDHFTDYSTHRLTSGADAILFKGIQDNSDSLQTLEYDPDTRSVQTRFAHLTANDISFTYLFESQSAAYITDGVLYHESNQGVVRRLSEEGELAYRFIISPDESKILYLAKPVGTELVPSLYAKLVEVRGGNEPVELTPTVPQGIAQSFSSSKSNESLHLAPRFSPDSKFVVVPYLNYEAGDLEFYFANTSGGEAQIIADFPIYDDLTDPVTNKTGFVISPDSRHIVWLPAYSGNTRLESLAVVNGQLVSASASVWNLYESRIHRHSIQLAFKDGKMFVVADDAVQGALTYFTLHLQAMSISVFTTRDYSPGSIQLLPSFSDSNVFILSGKQTLHKIIPETNDLETWMSLEAFEFESFYGPVDLTLVPGGESLLFIGKRINETSSHIFKLSANGDITNLTEGLVTVSESVVGATSVFLDEHSNSIFFEGTFASESRDSLYVMGLDGGDLKRLSGVREGEGFGETRVVRKYHDHVVFLDQGDKFDLFELKSFDFNTREVSLVRNASAEFIIEDLKKKGGLLESSNGKLLVGVAETMGRESAYHLYRTDINTRCVISLAGEDIYFSPLSAQSFLDREGKYFYYHSLSGFFQVDSETCVITNVLEVFENEENGFRGGVVKYIEDKDLIIISHYHVTYFVSEALEIQSRVDFPFFTSDPLIDILPELFDMPLLFTRDLFGIFPSYERFLTEWNLTLPLLSGAYPNVVSIPESSTLLIGQLNEDKSHLKLIVVDTTTGEEMELPEQLSRSYQGSLLPVVASPDGKWLLYIADIDGVNVLYRASVENGETFAVENEVSLIPARVSLHLSPDGRHVVYSKVEEDSMVLFSYGLETEKKVRISGFNEADNDVLLFAPTQLDQLDLRVSGAMSNGNVVFSDDGLWIYYLSRNTATDNYHIFKSSVMGEQTERMSLPITDEFKLTGYAVVPGSSALVYSVVKENRFAYFYSPDSDSISTVPFVSLDSDVPIAVRADGEMIYAEKVGSRWSVNRVLVSSGEIETLTGFESDASEVLLDYAVDDEYVHLIGPYRDPNVVEGVRLQLP